MRTRRITLQSAEPGFAPILTHAPRSIRAEAKSRGILCFQTNRQLEFVLVHNKRAVVFRESEPYYCDNTHSRHNNKFDTQQKLARIGISVPKGQTFEPSSLEAIKEFWQESGFRRAVLKPVDSNKGFGVTVGIKNKSELGIAYRSIEHRTTILEEFIEGFEHRILVVGGQVIAACKRIPAHVVGDGRLSIQQLIVEKNNIRSKTKTHQKNIIRIDDSALGILKSQGHELSKVLPIGTAAYLRNVSNVSMGGDSVDVTDSISEYMIDVARRIWKAFPDRAIYGVDLITEDISRHAPDYAVIEVNNRPMLNPLHGAPIKGLGRDVVAKIVDYIFPETKKLS